MRISKGAPRFYVTARNKHELRCVQRSQHCCSVAELACWFLVFTAPIAKAERHFPGGAPSLSRAPSTARMALDATVICNRQRHKETYPVSRPDCASLHQPYAIRFGVACAHQRPCSQQVLRYRRLYLCSDARIGGSHFTSQPLPNGPSKMPETRAPRHHPPPDWTRCPPCRCPQ